LTGFSHGAAGFAYALTSLAKVSSREEFEDAAQECIAFEDSHYDKTVLNWPDLRSSDESIFVNQWCHGATGIGLARVASSRSGKTRVETIVSDINHALQNTTANWPQRVDTLCCGTLGTIEFLAEASELLSQPALGHLSDQRLAQIIANRQEQGNYAWDIGGTAFNLGLFRGLSGVGYTILRKLDPSLPNVLMWE
jgi:lantibiotic modifying enzyme